MARGFELTDIPVVRCDALDRDQWYLIADWTAFYEQVLEFFLQAQAVDRYGLCAGCDGMGV